MTQKRRSSVRKLVGILIFVVLVAVSGYGLSTSGDFRNPFTAVTGMLSGGSGREAAGAPPTGDSTTGQPPQRDNATEAGGDSQSTISWSEMGGMLFNLWFMAAASAFVMVIQYPLGFLIRRMRSLIRPPAAVPA